MKKLTSLLTRNKDKSDKLETDASKISKNDELISTQNSKQLVDNTSQNLYQQQKIEMNFSKCDGIHIGNKNRMTHYS